jgi:pimeloyl-ACP methyl ester carboxylesterase
MTDNAPIHATLWSDSPSPRASAVLVHGSLVWGDDEEYGFTRQRPLADRYRLLAVDRRNYGASPDAEVGDYHVDADDVLDLLAAQPGGAHLLGHSYGGVVAMLAATRRPDLVRSLTLIEPGAIQTATDLPAPAEFVARRRRAAQKAGRHPGQPDGHPAEQPQDLRDALRAATAGLTATPVLPTPLRLRAARAAQRELPCFDAELDLPALAAARWPKLVVRGTWESRPQAALDAVGNALMATADHLAQRLNAHLLVVPGAGHWPHAEAPTPVNAALRALWDAAEEGGHGQRTLG